MRSSCCQMTHRESVRELDHDTGILNGGRVTSERVLIREHKQVRRDGSFATSSGCSGILIEELIQLSAKHNCS